MSNITRLLAMGSILALSALAYLITSISFEITMNAAESLGSKIGMADTFRNLGMFAEGLKVFAPIAIVTLNHFGERTAAKIYLLSTVMAISISMFASYTTTESIVSESSTTSQTIEEINRDIEITQDSYEKNVTDGQRGNARLDRKRLDELNQKKSDELSKISSGQSNALVEYGVAFQVTYSLFVELGSQAVMYAIARLIMVLFSSIKCVETEKHEKPTETECENETVLPVEAETVAEPKEKLIRSAILGGANINYNELTKEFGVGRSRLKSILASMEANGEVVRDGKKKLILSSKQRSNNIMQLVHGGES